MFRADSEEVVVAGVVVVLEAGVVGIGMAAVVSAGIDVVGTGVAVVVVLEEAVADVVDSVVAVGAKGMAVVRRDDSVAMVAAPINELNLIKYFLEIKSAERYYSVRPSTSPMPAQSTSASATCRRRYSATLSKCPLPRKPPPSETRTPLRARKSPTKNHSCFRC